MKHCQRGHAMDEENAYIAPKTGIANCRQCARDRRGFFKPKPCAHCEVPFYKPGGGKYCEDCVPDRKAYDRLKRFGIDNVQFVAMYFEQDGTCPICHVNEATETDHDHVTGKVRALLCDRCNPGLGFFQDSALRLVEAAAYVLEHND